MSSRFKRLWSETEAATAVEYAVMLALILLAAFAAIVTLGQQTAQSWNNSNQSLNMVDFGS